MILSEEPPARYLSPSHPANIDCLFVGFLGICGVRVRVVGRRVLRRSDKKKKSVFTTRAGARVHVHVHVATATPAPDMEKRQCRRKIPASGRPVAPVVAQEATGKAGRARTEGVRTFKRYYLLPAEHLIPSH